MNIAIDVTPLSDTRLLGHRVRGTGFYIENLKNSLLQYFPKNKYIFFTRGDKLPKNIDITHYPYFEPFFLILPFSKRSKTVVTVHDMTPFVFPRHFPPGLKGELRWYIQRFLLRRSDAIIADSLRSKKDVENFVKIDSNKVYTVYLSAGDAFKKIVNSSALRSTKEKYKLPDAFALYVGDATWNKNLPRIIQAVKKIHTPLVMVGKALIEKDFDPHNPWNADLLQIQKLTEHNRGIIKLGFIPTEDLVSIYNLATVFTMPSLYEGFGLPILEAMSCGCPVVTSREGSIPEIAGDAAYFVDAYDIENIANGIREVFYNDKLQNNLSEKGFQQAKKFSWGKTATDTIKVYEKVVNKSK